MRLGKARTLLIEIVGFRAACMGGSAATSKDVSSAKNPPAYYFACSQRWKANQDGHTKCSCAFQYNPNQKAGQNGYTECADACKSEDLWCSFGPRQDQDWLLSRD